MLESESQSNHSLNYIKLFFCVHILYNISMFNAKEYHRRYYQEHREELDAKNYEWEENNRDKTRAYKRKYYSNNKEKVCKYISDRNRKDRAKCNERVRKWRKDNREKFLAHHAISNAKARNGLVAKPCRICGSTINVHAHHPDYSKPLSPDWLCPFHHAQLRRA